MKSTKRDWTRARTHPFRILYAFPLVLLLLAAGASSAGARHRVHRVRYAPPFSAMAIDLYSGRILYSKSPNALRYPASLTKVMTLYLLFDALRDGKLTMRSELKVSEHAAAQAPSKLGLKAGETISVADAIKAIVTKSANDVAVVIAEALAPTESDFARLMTQKARTIGMLNTTFRNASGLPNPDQRTTAQDLIILARHMLLDHPDKAKVFATRYFSYNGETFRNHNTMLFTYAGMEGLKTGFTSASGFNLIATARRGDKRLLGVVLGGASARSRNATMRTILDSGWRRALTLAAAKRAGIDVAQAGPAPAAQPPEARPQAASTEEAPRSARPEPEHRLPSAFTAPSAPPQKASRISREFLLSAIETGLALDTGNETAAPAIAANSSATGGARAVNADMSTDEPEDTDDVAGDSSPAGSAKQVTAAPKPARAVAQEAANMSVFAKTVPGRNSAVFIASTEQEPAPQIAGAPAGQAEPVPPQPPAETPPPAKASAEAAEQSPSEPQTLQAATAAESQAIEATDEPGPFHIQVGAFPDEAEAKERLQLVKDKLRASMIEGHPGFTMQVALPSGTMFRARFAHFEEAQARRVCAALHRKSIECITARAP